MIITKLFRRSFATAGSLYTWGETTYGWGRELNDKLRVPGPVEGFNDVVEVASGPYHLLLKTSNNQIFSVGLGDNGRLGNNSSATLEVPQPIQGLSGANIRQLAAGYNHSLALSQSGTVFAWGYGGRAGGIFKYLPFVAEHSPLGLGSSGDVHTPQVIESLNVPVTQIAAGCGLSLALTESGEVYGWGPNLNQISGEPSSVPILLEQINYFLHKHHAHVIKMKSVGRNAFFLLDNGRLYVIGENNAGVFGTRPNPRIVEDNKLYSMTKVVDEDFKGQRITDFSVSGNSLIFITDQGNIFYSGMYSKFRPEKFPVTGSVKSIFATYDSVGVFDSNDQISFINDAFIDNSQKKGNVIINRDPQLQKAFKIGGTYKLRYALVAH